MTALSFNFAPRASALGSRAPLRRDAGTSDVAAASHVETFKRACKFASTIVLLGGVGIGTVAVKIAIWMPHFNH